MGYHPVITGLANIPKSLFRYDRDSGVLYWGDPGLAYFKNERGYKEFLKRRQGKAAGHQGATGYLDVGIKGRTYRVHRVIWALENGRDPVGDIDHIDGCRTNNRLENLREATRSQNRANTGANANNKSGLKGVHWHKGSKGWRAVITKNRKLHYLGQYSTPEAAHEAYIEACHRLNGEFANTGIRP